MINKPFKFELYKTLLAILQPSSLHDAIKPDTTWTSLLLSSFKVKLLCELSESNNFVTVHVRITICSFVPAYCKFNVNPFSNII